MVSGLGGPWSGLHLASVLVLGLFFFMVASCWSDSPWGGTGSGLGVACRETERVGMELLKYSSLLFRAAFPVLMILTAS